ncbi:hypothetical protein LJC55_02255 [Eubacteriales bacterium OttesenSCG-928-N14]|nr:hypothetical protein [Eubacteriales bacterium OttesenSCG-928-N14]
MSLYRKQILIALMAFWLVFTACACSGQGDVSRPAGTASAAPTATDGGSANHVENEMIDISITIGSRVFPAKFYNNASAQAIVAQMPFTLDMEDYAAQEKVVTLGFALPDAATQQPAYINTGELYLWSGNSLVLFYTTFANSYSYVPIGYIVDTTGMVDALGSSSVQVSFAAGG